VEIKLNIPFNQLLVLARQLSPAQKSRLKKELEVADVSPATSPLKKLLLQGPVFSEEQIKTIEEAHKSISEWRTK
jgi:hypothetical protein